MKTGDRSLFILIACTLILAIFSLTLDYLPTVHSPTAISSKSQTAQATGAGASTYYVSTTGDDSNPGTIDQPWKSIERAFDNSQASYVHGSDTLYLRGGNYRYDFGTSKLGTYSISGTPGNPTKIAGYSGERAVIYLSDRIDSGWQKYAARPGAGIWYFDWKGYMETNHPWNYANGALANNSYPGEMIPALVAIDSNPPRLLQEVDSAKNAQDAEHITSFRTNQDDMIAGDFYYEPDSTNPNFGKLFVWLPDGSDPDGKPIEVPTNSDFSFGEGHDLNISNISAKYGNDGAINTGITSSNIVFDNINDSYNATYGLIGQCVSCTVKNSVLSYNGDVGSMLEGQGTIYENNRIEENNYRIYQGWNCGGLKLIPYINDMIIRGNTFRNDVECADLWFDTMGAGHIIENNTFIHDSTLPANVGLMTEISRGTAADPIIVRNNVFQNTTFYNAGSSYVYALNNLFIGGQAVIHGVDPNSCSDDRCNVSNNKILNNIFVYTPAYNDFVPVFIVQNVPASIDASNNVSDYNVFYKGNSQPLRFGGQLSWLSNYSLSDWNALGFDTHSTTSDPLIADIPGGNFKPQSNSPVLGLGQVTSYVTNDILGNPRNGINDPGPYQLSVVTPPQPSQPPVSTTPPISTTPPDPARAIIGATVGSSQGSSSIFPPNISSIQVSVSGSSATISWKTDQLADSQIQYGITNAYENVTTRVTNLSNFHSITISSLKSGTQYHFIVISNSGSGKQSRSPDISFTTPGPSPYQTANTGPVHNTSGANSAANSNLFTYVSPSSFINVVQSTGGSGVVELLPTKIARNLKLGDQGEDVRLLEEQLNRDGYTVATSGPGSPGHETTIFTEQTKKALVEYQTSYSNTGVNPSGNLDNVTMVLINQDLANYYNGQSNDTTAKSTSTSSSVSQQTRSRLSAIILTVVDGVNRFAGDVALKLRSHNWASYPLSF